MHQLNKARCAELTNDTRCRPCGPCICQIAPAPPALFRRTGDKDEGLKHTRRDPVVAPPPVHNEKTLAALIARLPAEQMGPLMQMLKDRHLLGGAQEEDAPVHWLTVPGDQVADLCSLVAAMLE